MNGSPTSEVPQASGRWERYLPVIGIVLLGVGFSVTLLSAMRWWDAQSVERAFQLAAKDRATAVKNAFDTEVAMLELIRSALTGAGEIDRREFREILAPFHARSQSIEAVEWVPRVPDSRRLEYMGAARRDGLAGFQITELDKDGQLVKAKQRNEYFPIFYSGPKGDNKAVLGYDVASEPVRLESLDLARDTGKTVASGQFAFLQDKTSSRGFLACLPVYEKDKSVEMIADRRANLMGFILGVFRPANMIESALARLQPEGIDVCLYDPTDSGDKGRFNVHASRLRADRDMFAKAASNYSAQLNVAGHPWTVVCASTPAFEAAHKSLWPWGAFAAGLAATAMLAAYLLLSIRHTVDLEEKVREQTADLRHAQDEVIWRVVSASRWSDDESEMHIKRTGLLSQIVAGAAGWFGEELDSIRQAAPLHDVGKIGVPDAILQKPDKLTPEEQEVMKTHTLIGAEILADSKMPMLQMAQEIALNHHERWDGLGYPRGIAAEEIPECARIVAIVDTFDALMHDRVYRPAMSQEESLAILRQGAGTQFDPRLLAHFFRRLPEIRAILAEHPDGARRSVPKAPSLQTPLWPSFQAPTDSPTCFAP